RPGIWTTTIACTLMLLTGCQCPSAGSPSTDTGSQSADSVANAPVQPDQNVRILFDGNSLGQWTPTEFGGGAEVEVEDGCIILPQGNDMTGVTWTGDVVRMNYELSLEAKRVMGNDFFCGLTFP